MTEPTMPLRRSLLFVPGAEPRKIERARDTAADALILDLEDSVAPEQKAEARRIVTEAVGELAPVADVHVRINAPGTPWFEADLEAVVAAGVRTILLPKAESDEGVGIVVQALRGAETQAGRGEDQKVRLLLLVESPLGIANAFTIPRTSSRIGGLCFGHADFSREMGLPEADASAGVVFHARCALAIAAKAARVTPIDCVHLAVRDEAGFREDASLGLRLGFEGKLCIHPRQAEIANEVYTPTPEEIDRARRVVEAAETAGAEGRGVFTLDGRMIDVAVVLAERRILERARRAGVLAR